MPINISEFGAQRPKSKSLRQSALLSFFRHQTNRPDITIEEADQYAAEYITTDPEKILSDIISFTRTITETRTPGTVNSYQNILRDWLRKNKVIFDDLQEEEIKRSAPKNYAVTEDEPLTVEKIRSIVAHADTLLTAFILMACSSGARIGELLSLQVDDIEYMEEYDVYSFRLSHRQTKAGKPHRYFISHEAHQAVTDYLRVRAMYQASRQTKTVKCLGKQAADDNRLFGVTDQAIRKKLDNAVIKANLFSRDTESGRRRIHPHSFRKFADTTFKEVVGINMGNALIGHDEGLSKAYRRYDLRQLAEAYRKIEPYVTIKAPADYIQVKTHIGGEVDKIRAALAAQSLELADVKQRLEYTEIKLEIAKRHIKG